MSPFRLLDDIFFALIGLLLMASAIRSATAAGEL